MNKELIQKFPEEAGIYMFKNKKGEILYIGKAKNLKKRVAQYFSPNSVRKQDMVSRAENIDFLIVKNESEALYLEDNLIKQNKPEFNNLLKADNSYAYVKITSDEFPQIFLTRKKFNPATRGSGVNDGSTYIGPKHNTIHLKKFIQYLRQILQFRGCKNTQFKQGKLCSDYYFGLCKGRCVVAASKDAINRVSTATKDYQKIIGLIESFFKGNTYPIQHEIKSQIEKAVKEENFERAGKLRDIYVNIDELAEQQTVVIQKPITGYLSKIKKIGTYRVYCTCNFYEGKLIDVIRGKEHIEDMDQDELQKSLEREFGALNIIPSSPDPFSFREGENRSSHSSLKERRWRGGKNESFKISKSDRKNIDALMERFFDSYIISTSFEGENLNNDVLSELQKRYHLKHFPYRIECIDISHLSGGRMSGGLSCLVEGLKNPKGYRRYKIQHKEVDDYAALKEVIERRVKTGNLPDLLVLDGGKGQLGIIKKMKDLLGKMDIISLGKGQARTQSQRNRKNVAEKIYSFDKNLKIQSQDLIYDEVDKVLLKARDEAHRFANSYRKKQMSKEFSSK